MRPMFGHGQHGTHGHHGRTEKNLSARTREHPTPPPQGGVIFMDFGSNFAVLGRGSGSKRCAPRFPTSSRSKSSEIFLLVPKMALYPRSWKCPTQLGGPYLDEFLIVPRIRPAQKVRMDREMISGFR